MPGGHERAGPRGASPESGRHAPLSGHARGPGSGDARHRSLPVVIELKRFPSTHDRKGIEQELVHARPERLHLRQGPVGPLDEPIVVRTDARVVLQAREGREVEDLAEPGATPMAHPLPAADRLASVAARGIRARQLDELPAVVILCDGPDGREEPGHAGPAQAGYRPQVLDLRKLREHAIDLRDHRRHVGGEHSHPRHRPLHFALEDVERGAGNGLRRLAVDLGQFEAPDPVAGAVRADLGHELSEGQGGHRRGGQACTQDGQGPRLQQIRPDAPELGEEPVELMGDQDLEPRPLLPEPDILAPGAPQRQVGAGLQLGPRDQAGPAELGDLLGIGQIRLLATELPVARRLSPGWLS